MDECFMKIVHLRQNLEKVNSVLHFTSPCHHKKQTNICLGTQPSIHGSASRETEEAAASKSTGAD